MSGLPRVLPDAQAAERLGAARPLLHGADSTRGAADAVRRCSNGSIATARPRRAHRVYAPNVTKSDLYTICKLRRSLDNGGSPTRARVGPHTRRPCDPLSPMRPMPKIQLSGPHPLSRERLQHDSRFYARSSPPRLKMVTLYNTDLPLTDPLREARTKSKKDRCFIIITLYAAICCDSTPLHRRGFSTNCIQHLPGGVRVRHRRRVLLRPWPDPAAPGRP